MKHRSALSCKTFISNTGIYNGHFLLSHLGLESQHFGNWLYICMELMCLLTKKVPLFKVYKVY